MLLQQRKIVLIALFVLGLTSCGNLLGEQGNGDRVDKTFTVDSFDAIELSGSYDVTLFPSKSHDITLSVDENLLRFIKIEVTGKTLHIESDRSLNSPKGIFIEIPVKRLEMLTSSGASNITCKEPLRLKDLGVELSGAGKIDLKLDAESVSIELSGACLVYLQGVAQKLDVEMSGAGSLEAEDFEVENCSVDISGVGNAVVNVTGSLEAQVSGLGKVEYTGSPKSVKGDVSGIGEIEKGNN